MRVAAAGDGVGRKGPPLSGTDVPGSVAFDAGGSVLDREFVHVRRSWRAMVWLPRMAVQAAGQG